MRDMQKRLAKLLYNERAFNRENNMQHDPTTAFELPGDFLYAIVIC